MSNLSRYLKKRALQDSRNEEEGLSLQNSTLVNMSSNRNVLAMQFNVQDPNTSTAPASVAAVTASNNSNKQSMTETSFINIEQPKSVIVEKNLPHSRGDAV